MLDESRIREWVSQASTFAALADPTRLLLVLKLTDQAGQSITQLAGGTALTRQAVTKHLAVLEESGLARSRKQGRETAFELRPEAFGPMLLQLELISAEWKNKLSYLKDFVERNPE